ncbi:YhcB family protein [Lacihabitans sp. LS3-19]|uniref:YhcB family protein n=1 Tax=Lacihabitans sp. LS3-19 TaxID=2487335 RepID=UPI0020CDF238|nr:YhcB family protein [Lacihabitans sp. LS3-19]
MKIILNKIGLSLILFLSVLISNAQPTGRGGASGDDNEWLMFLIIGLVVGALIGYFGGKFQSNSKK